MMSFLVALVLVLLSGATSAQTPIDTTLSNIGRLTCTTSETPPTALADAELSCSFQSASGKSGDFTGYIARVGESDLPPGKRVLAWFVLTANNDAGLRDLSGAYEGRTGGEPAGRLVGGRSNSIVLQPTTVTSQIGEVPVPTILRLRLEPLRA